MTEAIRIAVLNFVHETVTFLPNDTALADFVYDGSPAKGEALLAWEPLSYMGERLLRLSLRRRAGCRHDGPGHDQRQARACAHGR
jgi:hypothetical protein